MTRLCLLVQTVPDYAVWHKVSSVILTGKMIRPSIFLGEPTVLWIHFVITLAVKSSDVRTDENGEEGSQVCPSPGKFWR